MPSLGVSTVEHELSACGYRPPLLIRDFPFGSGGAERIPLAAFADEPPDAASACIGVIPCGGAPEERLLACRELGAPVYFVLGRDRFQWWRQGTKRPQHLESLEPNELPGFFRQHRDELAPQAIYRAKTRGRFEHAYQLSFVDSGLMPLVESEICRTLGALVESLVLEVRQSIGKRELGATDASSLLRCVFWLMAAKILGDKRVEGFEDLDLTDVDVLFSRVSAHYGDRSPSFRTGRSLRRALALAAKRLERFASLAHVTPESLAGVYETALVSKQTRSALGTHSTPGFLARYVVWRLTPWIEQIPAADRHVLEPTCGQGTFLVAAMRLLRDLLPPTEDRPRYLRQHLHGIDVDAFAVELARLSLTLADVPNSDGWKVHPANVFSNEILERAARRGAVLLGNPPFEHFTPEERAALATAGCEVSPGSKAAEILRRTLCHLPAGGVFGVVVPLGLLEANHAADLRSFLAEHCELAEITLLPENVFTFSQSESALLLGRRLDAAARPERRVRYLRVRQGDLDQFRRTYTVGDQRKVAQSRFNVKPGGSFLLPELEAVWHACRGLPLLKEIADLGRGIEYESAEEIPPGTQTFAAKSFRGSRIGYAKLDKGQFVHQPPPAVWLNLDPDVIRRKGTGCDEGIAQILVNRFRISREHWRLKAILDPEGRPVKNDLLTVRPQGSGISILYLWAILNSPLANAFLLTHSRDAENRRGTFLTIPVPTASGPALTELEGRVERYLAAARSETMPRDLPGFLLAIDAELLRLYDLPPRTERQLLDHFAGYPRAGVPFLFDRYFPVDFRPCFSLHRYLSPGLRRSTAGELRRRWSPAPEIVRQALAIADEAFSG